jgi:NADPH:quinone reductase-like Zn-dependent oxidoreductase
MATLRRETDDMQAIILTAQGSADNFHLAELPTPALREGDVRIAVRSVSFNPIDYQNRKGTPGGSKPQSRILGRDLSGVVDAVDGSVSDFRPGDEVYSYVCNLASSGTYAEYVSVPSELVAKKPKSLTHDQAAAVPVAGITASLALEKAQANASRSLFVAGGAGGVGTFVIMLAQRAGVVRLITTAGNAASHAYLIERCGLRDDQIVNYKDDRFAALAIALNGGPFHGVLDLVGGALLSAGCNLLAVDGNLVSVTEAPSQEDFEVLFQRNASFHSIGANAYSLASDRACWRRYQVLLRHLATSFDSGTLHAPQIQNVGMFSVETVRRAHDMLERSTVQGKLVMSFQ